MPDDIREGSADIPVTPHQEQRAALPKPVMLETRWRAAAPKLTASIETLTTDLQQCENERGLRKRARKAADEEKFARTVEAICCNFAAVVMFDASRAVTVKRANYASRHSPVYGAHFKRVTGLMKECGLLTGTTGYHVPGFRHGVPSTIHPTSAYWDRMPKPEGWAELRLEDDNEPVVVKAADDGHCTLPPAEWLGARVSEMARINQHLKAIPLAYAGLETIPPIEDTRRPTILLLSPHHRTVRRVFKGNVEHGGRLYDGFWETMPRDQRFRKLSINGEPVVNVDFGQLFIRLAYAQANCQPPQGDLYDLTGRDCERDDWHSLREGRKRMVNAMLSGKPTLKQWPGNSATEKAEIRSLFPEGTKPSRVVASIEARHAAIAAEWFGRGRGLELHRLESDILVAVLLRLIDLKISALPLHDSVIVARSHGEAAWGVMRDEALRLVGVDMPVKIDAG
ncbi:MULTISPECIES: hypothetical protein [unclassified Bradyrhizobium]|uniref:hypothetical protein n=1 Tax=unclassified Bradyrhizobium TaxID=2631580 RepID=UPI0028E36ACD|nr:MULTISPECIES: hypothetical protein [unclassified Bradyrhizobium]